MSEIIQEGKTTEEMIEQLRKERDRRQKEYFDSVAETRKAEYEGGFQTTFPSDFSPEKENKNTTQTFTIKLHRKILQMIKMEIEERPGLTSSQWIRDAIWEKLEKGNNDGITR